MPEPPFRMDPIPHAPAIATRDAGADQATDPADDGESRHRRVPSAETDPTGAVKLTLTDPDTAPMTSSDHAQAVDALASLIVSWLRCRARHSPDGNDPEADR
jgi:hypothetical protein